MASGEIRLEGAIAYLVGDVTRGLKQMMAQVNLSRLSHGVRAAAMMRRCVNEALVCARTRVAFGERIIRHPLLRRQLLKLIVPTEQALSMTMAARAMDEANAGSREAQDVVRILTPLLKFRVCRDNIPVATGSMEVRGGNGTSRNGSMSGSCATPISACSGKAPPTSTRSTSSPVRWARAARTALAALVKRRLDAAANLPDAFRSRLAQTFDRAVVLAERVAGEKDEPSVRLAASALYHATSAVLLAWEGAQPGVDPRRALYARFVLDHRLSHRDPLEPENNTFEREAIDLVLGEGESSSAQVMRLLER
jgi:hypothetical protein